MIDTFQLTAAEVAASEMYEDEQWEFMRRREFRLAGMNSRDREAMIDAMVEELGIKGGWFWRTDDGVVEGPFKTESEARRNRHENDDSDPAADRGDWEFHRDHDQ